MSEQPVLIAGEWRKAERPTGTFSAVDPVSKTPLRESYPVSSFDDLALALQAAEDAVVSLRAVRKDDIANFLEQYAREIETRSDALVELAARETGLATDPRLRTVELPRTTHQLRQAAAAARDRSWCHATIDSKINIRSCYAALGGAVVVFGPNNFPFAFNSVAGGDFAAAIATGNPVIGKANPGHPGTTKMLAECARAALRASALPAAMVQLVYRTPPELGCKLVSHPSVAATGFTGSKGAGLQLKQAADRAGRPIYLEMSSVNPVFILPGALEERLSAVAKELADSCALGAGQFCTRPGITVLIKSDLASSLVEQLAALFRRSTPGTLLGESGLSAIASGLDELVKHGAEIVTGGGPVDGPRYCFANTLLRVSGKTFLANPHALQTEAFGTVNMVVLADDLTQMAQIAGHLEGSLTGCIYSDSRGMDDDAYRSLAPMLRQKVGRLLNDKMPTGVAVSPAMNHGGPYPATGHPGFTAVGIPASLLRFAALHCYDNVRPNRLPEELWDRNPTGTMWRFIDGRWSQGDVAS